MSNKIFKYELDFKEKQTLSLQLMKILDVKYINNKFYTWVIIDECLEQSQVEFICIGTGQEFDCDIDGYISTVEAGSFIFHWFFNIIKGE